MKLTDLQKLNQDPKIKASICFLQKNGYSFEETSEGYLSLFVTNPAGSKFTIKVFNIRKLAECVLKMDTLLIEVSNSDMEATR